MIETLIAAGMLLVPAALFFAGDAPDDGEAPPLAEAPPMARLVPEEKPPEVGFRWWHGLIALGLFVALQMAGVVAYMLVTGRRSLTEILPLLVLGTAAELVLTGIVAAAAWRLYGSVREGLGLRFPEELRVWLWVPFGLALAYVVTISYDMLLRLYGMQFEQKVAVQLTELRGVGPWIAVMLCAGLLVPIAEEVVFRGCMYTGLKKNLGSLWAAVLSSLAFMIVHGEPIAFPPIFIIGMITAFVYERTRSLYVPIAVHAINNLIALTVVALS